MPRTDDDEPVLLLRKRKPTAKPSTRRDEDVTRIATPVRPAPATVRDRLTTSDQVTIALSLPEASPPSDSLTRRTSRSELLDRALGRSPKPATTSHDAVTKITSTAWLLEDPATRRGTVDPSARVRRDPAPLAETVVAPMPVVPSKAPAKKGSRLPPRVAPQTAPPRVAEPATPPPLPSRVVATPRAAAPPAPPSKRRASFRKTAEPTPETILASVELRGRAPRPPAPSASVAIALVSLANGEGFALRYLGAAGHVLLERRFGDCEVAKMYAMHEQDLRPHHWIDRASGR